MTNIWRPLFQLVLPGLLLLFGCAAPQEEFRHSDFLGDYSGFQPLGKFRGAQGFAKPGLSLAGYGKMMIDPVQVRSASATPETSISPDEQQQLAATFHSQLSEELGKSFALVTQPGPGVLRLRTAITGMAASYNLGMASDPAGGYRTTLPRSGETPDSYLKISGASMEMELLDAASGERLAAMVDRKGDASGASPEKTLEAVFNYWAAGVGDILASLRSR